MRTDGNADAAHLRSAALAGIRLALVPPERLLALVERLDDECARQLLPLAVRLCRTEDRAADGRVDLPDLDLIDAELLRRFRDERLDYPVALHRTRRALLRPRRRVGQHADGAPPHRRGLVDDRRGETGGAVIAHRPVR